MAGQVPLFERDAEGLLHQISPELAEQKRNSMRFSSVALTIDVLFTPEEEAERDAEEQAALAADAERVQAQQEQRSAAEGKLKALGLTKEDLRALLA